MSKKICSRCKKVKDIEEFHKKSRNNPKPRHICKECHNEVSKRDSRRYVLKRKYNFEDGDYESMLIEQDGKCAICRVQKTLQIDHDHNTGKIRGLLCMNCNTALGGFRDDIQILSNAINYLINHISEELSSK